MGKELEPIDATRCQAEIKGGSFMTFGPREYRRCKAKPTWVGLDVRQGVFFGAMSLCDAGEERYYYLRFGPAVKAATVCIIPYPSCDDPECEKTVVQKNTNAPKVESVNEK